jgi:hypothetical protein
LRAKRFLAREAEPSHCGGHDELLKRFSINLAR